MLRALFALAVLLIALPGGAAPSRWASQSLEGAQSLHVAGREPTALIVLRGNMDPLRSFDGGATWTPFRVANGVPTVVKVSPTDARTWYADSGLGQPPYRTRDGGNTWTVLGKVSDRAPNLYPRIGDIQVGAHPDLLYARRYHGDLVSLPTGDYALAGIIVSRDGGETWSEFPFPGQYLVGFQPSTADPNVAWALSFAEGAGTVHRTRDNGATWVNVGANLPVAARSRVHLALDRRDASIAYLVPDFEGLPVWSSVDGGASWVSGPQSSATIFTFRTARLVPDPLQAGRAFDFNSNGLVRETRDAGRTWVLANAGEAGRYDYYPPAMIADGARRRALTAQDAKLRALDLTDGAVALGSDLWWNTAESGSGITITQHASNRPFIVWYTYDATGAPVWRVMPGGSWNDRTLTGTLYETTGPAYFAGPFDPSRVATRAVGTATLRFEDESNAAFAYSLGAVAGEKRITRQLFAPPATSSIESYADLWWNEAESGWGMGVNHQHNRIFATWYVYGPDGRPLWVVMPDAVVGQEFVGAIVQPVATGKIYTTRGPAAGSPYDPAQVVATQVGTATLHLRGARIDLEYTAFGRSETRTLTRQPF